MIAYVFPGQGAQVPGIGKKLYHQNLEARNLFEEANEILKFRITDIMFDGTNEELQETEVTQPAVFLYSFILAKITPGVQPNVVAGHSLGEYTALTMSGAVSFEDGLRLVYRRAKAMQKACKDTPSSMAVVTGLPQTRVEEICGEIDGVVVPANYNSLDQMVISGTKDAVKLAMKTMKNSGAKWAMPLRVHGAFHSPLMKSASEELCSAIMETDFRIPNYPIYQNVDGKATTDTGKIINNLIAQLTSPVRWDLSIKHMISDGVTKFLECGPRNILADLIKNIWRQTNGVGDLQISNIAPDFEFSP